MYAAASALALFLAATAVAAPQQGIEQSDFGKMPDGTPVRLFALRNAHGLTAKVITYGCIITEFNVPDRNGVFTNVVLGTNNLEAYLKGFPAPAAIMGRVANRIAHARFTLDGIEYKLSANNGANHLHGVFGRVVWQGK